MKTPETTDPRPDATYTRLQERANAAATQKRSRPREDYLRALDKAHAEQLERAGAAVTTPHASVRGEVLPAEHAERVAAQPLAEQATRWLTVFAAPTPTTHPRVAAAGRQLRDAVQAAQTSSDPAPVEAVMQAIDDIPETIDSPAGRAVTFYKFAVLPLLNRGRSVPSTVQHVEALVQQLKMILAEVGAEGPPPIAPMFSVPDTVAPRPRRARGALSRGDAA